MTKEEFISIAQQSSDRADMLSKMGHEFSKKNIETYIKIPRQAFGITVDEMFSYFSEPYTSKEIYLSHVSASKSQSDLFERMGYNESTQNMVKYIIDPGRKFGVTLPAMKEVWARNSATGSAA
jgi:hypothetical protein